jgi:ubiquinone biosynthesis protein
MGWKALWSQLQAEAPLYAKLLPALPRLAQEALLVQTRHTRQQEGWVSALQSQRRLLNAVLVLSALACMGVGLLAWRLAAS